MQTQLQRDLFEIRNLHVVQERLQLAAMSKVRLIALHLEFVRAHGAVVHALHDFGRVGECGSSVNVLEDDVVGAVEGGIEQLERAQEGELVEVLGEVDVGVRRDGRGGARRNQKQFKVATTDRASIILNIKKQVPGK